MSLLSNNAEGQANGTVVTTANSGGASGTAFNAVTLNTNTLTFDSSQYMHGLMSYDFGLNSGITSWVTWNSFSGTQLVLRFYVMLSALPNSAIRLCDIVDSAAVVPVRILVNASNHFLLQLNTGATTAKTFANPLVANTWYRVELATTNGTSNATVTMDYYEGDSLTPVEAGYSTTTANTGSTNNLTTMKLGSSATSSTLVGNMWLDDIAISTGTLTYLGPSGTGGATVAWLGV